MIVTDNRTTMGTILLNVSFNAQGKLLYYKGAFGVANKALMLTFSRELFEADLWNCMVVTDLHQTDHVHAAFGGNGPTQSHSIILKARQLDI